MGILIVVTFLDLIRPKITEEWWESNRLPLKNPLVSTISWSILDSREYYSSFCIVENLECCFETIRWWCTAVVLIGRLFGYALPDTINTRKAKSGLSKRFSGLIINRLIVVFSLFPMKTQNISAVYCLTTRRSVIKSWSCWKAIAIVLLRRLADWTFLIPFSRARVMECDYLLSQGNNSRNILCSCLVW